VVLESRRYLFCVDIEQVPTETHVKLIIVEVRAYSHVMIENNSNVLCFSSEKIENNNFLVHHDGWRWSENEIIKLK